MHPGDNKQSVPLALAIFDQSTSAALESYHPNRLDASSFLKVINIWWTINNSKQEFNSNYQIGNAAVKDDKKPSFLREFAKWLEKWQSLQCQSSQKYTLSKQTNTALVITLKCIASLIEDLLIEKEYKYVLTSRFQTDCLELRFSKYRQMSGGRFLIGLREMQVSERILSTVSLLKASINIWDEDVRLDAANESMWTIFRHDLESLESDIEKCMLDEEGLEVVTVIAGYIAKQTNKNTNCDLCKDLLTRNTGNLSTDDYLNKLSRGGLTTPSTDLVHYVAKSFALLDCVKEVIRNSQLPERKLSEYVINGKNTYPDTFLCDNHKDDRSKINRIITNIYYNNEQKKLKDTVRKDSVKEFKQRQRKRQKTN